MATSRCTSLAERAAAARRLHPPRLCAALFLGAACAAASAAAPVAARSDGAQRLSAAVAGSLQNPAFSPDGTRLLFTVFDNGYNVGPSSLYLLDLDTGMIALLTSAPDSDSVNLPGTSWSPVTDRITFASDRQAIDEVWTIAADGTAAKRVTTHAPPARYSEPSYSPDGTWIVFELDPGTPGATQGSIWTVRADGMLPTPLSDGPGGGTDDRQPNWSPTDDRIVFQRRTPGSEDWNLFTVRSDGSDLRQITTSPYGDTDASWSPDGECLVYSSDDGGLPLPSLFVIARDGGTPVRVTGDDAYYDGAPSWSPDGGVLVFESSIGDPDGSPGTTLWRIEAPLCALFADGFESGDSSAWPITVP